MITIDNNQQFAYDEIMNIIKADYTEDQNRIIGAFIRLIKTAREEMGLSVRELGAKANVSYTVIYDLENKNILPKFETINKLANALEFYIDVNTNEKGQSNMLTLLYCKAESMDKSKNQFNKRLSKIVPNTKEEDLRTILTKYGLYSKDIEEVENFIKFKLSQH